MLVDLPLVTRVEQSAGSFAAAQVDVLAQRAPASGADWAPCDGGTLAAMGRGRYVNRGIGIGLGGTAPAALLDQVERFYRDRGMPPMLEVSPWVPEALVTELSVRGYTVRWFRDVYAHTLGDLPQRSDIDVRDVDDETVAEWSAILAGDVTTEEARRVSDEFSDAMHHVRGGTDLVAFIGGRPVATGSLTVVDNVGWLGGAATRAASRGQGAQRALLVERLHRARDAGCTLAAATALPSGVSARNLQRVGFRLLHSQVVMALMA